MAIISDITNELSKIDASLFQQLGEELLRRIYKPGNIISVGIGIEKNTTIKGTPDSIFIMQDGKILIEYTTFDRRNMRKLSNKLLGDLKACLNETKSHIPLSEIKAIVLFSNQRIDSLIQDRLKNEISKFPSIELRIFGIDDIAYHIVNYPSILKEYLGISSYPGLTDIDDFIKRNSEQKFRYPIPLDNDYFEFERNSIENGVESIKSNNILIISGNAGMGKTRYALEIAKRYNNSNSTIVFILEGKGQNISDVLCYLDSRKQYLLIIDDANRTATWDDTIEFFQKDISKNIKIIGTVRSYALTEVADKCSSVAGVEIIDMNEYPEDLASKILKSFKIYSPLWYKRINAITERNIRLAVMCAQVAKSKNSYLELHNVEGIYAEYYKPIFDQITNTVSDNLTIKVIAVIDFFKVIDLNKDYHWEQIESVFKISKEDFIKTCDLLSTKECIDWTVYDMVNIPDQNFGNFIFYKCFFELKCLSLSNLMEKMYYMDQRLCDCVYSVINCFHKNSVTTHIKESFKEAWLHVYQNVEDQYHVERFLESFCIFVPDITFSYIHKKIERLKNGEEKPLLTIDNEIIAILSRFSHSEKSDMRIAIFLMLDYLYVFPSEIDKMADSVLQNWIYEETDYARGYQRNADVLDCLIDVADKSNIALQFVGKIVPAFLKFTYDASYVKGRKFNIGDTAVYITDEIKALRRRAWKWIISNISRLNQVDLIKDLYRDYHDLKELKLDLVQREIDLVQECVNKLDINNNFQLCEELARLLTRMERILEENHLKIDWTKSNRLYQLDCLIENGCDRHDYENHNKIQQRNIETLVKSKSLSEVTNLLDDLAELSSYKGYDSIRLNYLIEYVLRNDSQSALNLCQHCINNNYDVMPSRIIATYLALGYKLNSLIDFIKSQNVVVRSNLILHFVMIAEKPSLHFTIHEISTAILHQRNIVYKINGIVKKFYPTGPTEEGYRSILSSILYRLRNGQPVSGSELFLVEFLHHYPSKSSLVKYSYIQSIKINNTQFRFDYDNILLREILRIYPDFWRDCCIAIPYFVHKHHIAPYEFIWRLDNHTEIIESTIVYYANRVIHGIRGLIRCDEEDNLYGFFNNLKDGKAAKFIDDMIIKYCHDQVISRIIFDIVVECMGRTKTNYYLRFISHNDDVEVFKDLKLFSNVMWGGYSCKSTISARKEYIVSLKDQIKSLGEIRYLDHISYLNKKLDALEREYQHELKDEHKNILFDS